MRGGNNKGRGGERRSTGKKNWRSKIRGETQGGKKNNKEAAGPRFGVRCGYEKRDCRSRKKHAEGASGTRTKMKRKKKKEKEKNRGPARQKKKEKKKELRRQRRKRNHNED